MAQEQRRPSSTQCRPVPTVVRCDPSSEPFHYIGIPRDHFIGSGNQGQGVRVCVLVLSEQERAIRVLLEADQKNAIQFLLRIEIKVLQSTSRVQSRLLS